MKGLATLIEATAQLAREIDQMYGWMPRDQVRLPPGALDLEKLREQLASTLAALDAMLAAPSAQDPPG